MSWQTPENLSADEIRATVTGTPGTGKPVVDDGASGLAWGAVPQAALNSGNKLGLAAGGTNADLSATGGATHFLRQASAGAAVTVGAIATTDLPTTLQAGTNSGGNFQVAGHLYLNSGGKLQPGTDNDVVVNANSGGAIYLQENANNQAWVNSDGLNASALYAYNIYSQGSSASYCSVSGRRQINGSDSAALVVYADNHATYPGAHQQFAPLMARAASTAFAVCPVATGDMAIVDIMEDGGTNGVMAFVTGGSVYLDNLMPSFTKNAAYVVSSTPGAAEVGVYLSAGVLYIKPGSSWTPKIGTFSKVWKA